ncbi:MAG: tripartite tricarboxylate transporter substrate binding protein [Xanthobacteraceae bacterium]|nr:tripartite tricarboxylate transporter substrate binding protein [Xanthobacteraceae bacterium]
MQIIARRRFLRTLGAAASVPLLARIASAQSYPTRTVRMVLPYAPAGVTDVVGRLIALKLSEQLGRQFVIENVPGATGNIGTAQVAKAPADGYTILVVFSSFVVNPTLFDRIPYDPYKDFDPVTLAVTSTTAVGVNPSVPAHSVKDLVALIRANPGKYSYSHAGTGTQSHLAGEQFRLKLKLDLVPVPFNGGGPAAASVVGGHTPVTFNSPTAILPHARDGKIRVLAVNSEARTAAMPEIPTIAEAGFPGIRGDSWVGVLAPAGTPKDIIALLQREIAAALGRPDMKERLLALGCDAVASTSEDFAARIKSEIPFWGDVIRAADIKMQ